jgi:hypothetical protein
LHLCRLIEQNRADSKTVYRERKSKGVAARRVTPGWADKTDRRGGAQGAGAPRISSATLESRR